MPIISIFLIPGDYIAVLGCRTGTTFMRDFSLPDLSMLLNTPRPPSLVISPFAGLYFCTLWSLCWLHSPELLQPAPPSVLQSHSAPFRPRLPYYPRLCGLWQPGCPARCLFVTEPFGQAWWSRLTVGIFDTCILIWTHADLFFVVITHRSYNHCYIPQLLSDLSIGKKTPSA